MRRLLLPLVAALVVTACTSSKHSDRPSLDGAPPPKAYTLSTATWTDQTGVPRTLTSGRVTLLYFGYTSCPDVCPTTLADVAVALRALKPAVAAKVDVVMITTDPVRDTPARLKQWLHGFRTPQPIIGLTAGWAQIHATAVADDVLLPDTEPATLEQVGHSAQIIGFGPGGNALVEWLSSEHLSKDLEHDVPLLVGTTT